MGPVEPTFTGGQEVLEEVISAGVTGVLAFNDMVALGIVSGARARGLHVPEDLSVVGSDDIPLGDLVDLPLTTVAAPLDAMGAAALDLVLDLADGRAVPATTRFAVTLVRRRTAARVEHDAG